MSTYFAKKLFAQYFLIFNNAQFFFVPKPVFSPPKKLILSIYAFFVEKITIFGGFIFLGKGTLFRSKSDDFAPISPQKINNLFTFSSLQSKKHLVGEKIALTRCKVLFTFLSTLDCFFKFALFALFGQVFPQGIGIASGRAQRCRQSAPCKI